MIPGPDKIIECPKCKGLARVFTLISGNTLGARRWTDGKMIAPMLPMPPAITKCRHCGHYFWVSDAKEVGELPLWRDKSEKIPSQWESSKHIKELSESEYLEAIRIKVAKNREQELYLRICAWWAGNDPFRFKSQGVAGHPESVPSRSSEARMNLEKLLELLDVTDPEQRLMKAEVLRELGRFDDTICLLESNYPSEYMGVVITIRNLVQKKDSMVREIYE